MAIAGAASAGGTVYSANKQADTATKAGDLSAKAASDTLAFQKTQAAQDQANWEAAQKFNIDQYNQKQSRLAPYINGGAWANTTLANLIGGSGAVAATKTPAPVATLPAMQGPLSSAAPGSSTAPTSGAPGSATAAASGNPTDPTYVAAQLTKYYQSMGLQPTGPGTGPTDLDYMTKQMLATGGWTPDNAAYWTNPTDGRILQELQKAKGGGAASASGAPANAAAGAQAPSLPMNFSNTSSPTTLSSLVRTPALAPAAPATLNNFWQAPRG